MRWQRQDVVIADRYLEETLSLTVEEDVKCIEGVKVLQYVGRLLDRLDNDRPSVLQNISEARQMQGQIGKMLRREGE